MVFGHQGLGGFTKDTNHDATWCRDLELFYESHKDRNDWKPHVHRVYIQCDDSYFDDDGITLLNEEDEAVWKVTSLFAHSASTLQNLKFFHTTTPHMGIMSWQNQTPACGITSLFLAMQDERDPGQGVDVEWMDTISYTLGEMPTLRFLEIRSWGMTEHPMVYSSFAEFGTWGITHLGLLECGPLTNDVAYVLQMLRDLQSLTMISELAPNTKRHGMDDPISIQEAVDALQSIKNSLKELDLDPGPSEHWIHPRMGNRVFPRFMEPYQSHAFVGFSKLQRLTAPLEIFSQSTGKMSRREDQTFYTNFPPSLQKLTLVVTSRESFNKTLEQTYALPDDKVVLEGRIVDLSDLSCQIDAYEKAHEMFEELSQLADHRYSMPALREVHLRRDPCQWLDCEHVKLCKRQLEQAGISVHVHDRAIEGPTQDNYRRCGSEL
ncbi:hypothetical protein KCU95_g1260, partial [Aureobasidium melanogenum]